MRTLSEINRDINVVLSEINLAKTNKEYLHYKALLIELKDEKEKVWNALFNKHRNCEI